MAFLIWVVLAALVAPVGRTRKIGIAGAFFVSLFFSPLIGLFVAMNSRIKNPRGCIHCGNMENEVEFCGICGKNEQGLTRGEVSIESLYR